MCAQAGESMMAPSARSSNFGSSGDGLGYVEAHHRGRINGVFMPVKYFCRGRQVRVTGKRNQSENIQYTRPTIQSVACAEGTCLYTSSTTQGKGGWIEWAVPAADTNATTAELAIK